MKNKTTSLTPTQTAAQDLGTCDNCGNKLILNCETGEPTCYKCGLIYEDEGTCGSTATTVDSQSPRQAARSEFNYERNAGICDAIRPRSVDLAKRYGLNEVDAYNFLLEGAEVQREYDKRNGLNFETMWRGVQDNFNKLEAKAIRLEKALIESRDILCALNTSEGATKLAYMLPSMIPTAIKNGYEALGLSPDSLKNEGEQ